MDYLHKKAVPVTKEAKGAFYFLKTRKFKTRVFLLMLLAWPLAHFLVFWV